MATRPVRLYHLTFRTTGGTQIIEFHRTGQTPCAAKNAAFVSLELELATRPDYPRMGWYLEAIREVSV